MELTFEKIGDWYISEFEVTSDFNLHIEKEPKGDFYLYQRTSSSGQYDIIEDFGYKKGGDNIIDLDFQALVYPKWIKIKSAVKPLIATITTDGEVNEVVYQAKDIEITSNGTTKVTADTGYTALGSVNVKVNVPQSGGGNSGGEGGGDWHYFDVSSFSSLELQVNSINLFIMLLKRQDKRVVGGGAIYNMENPIIAFATDYNTKISFDTGDRGHELITIGDMLSKTLDAAGGATLLEILYTMGMTEITKEEFYNINA